MGIYLVYIVLREELFLFQGWFAECTVEGERCIENECRVLGACIPTCVHKVERAELVVECRGLLLETGVFEVGLFRFRLKKKGGTSHDVPMLKKILVDFRLDLPFCILSFGVFAMQR